jgi:hypothetical protein
VKEVAELLNSLLSEDIITDYALFGAVAQMRYTEAVVTMDADVLVAVAEPDAIDLLSPIYKFCSGLGYSPEGEAVRVGDWPVQFIPVFDDLTRAAMAQAETGEIDGVPLRVVRADYLAVIAISVGRPKDLTRVLALLEAGAVTEDAIADLAAEHDLAEKWTQFRNRFLET